LEETNARFRDDILVPFQPTVGDEFQGALVEPANAYAVCTHIKGMFPVVFYCGVGVGNIERPLSTDVGMRGTAFYRARYALEQCKRKKTSILVRSSDGTSQADEIVNTLLHIIEMLEGSRTGRQREIVNYLRLHPDYTHKRVAKHLGISDSSVSQTLRAANWGTVLELEGLVGELLRCNPSGAGDAG
jgi:hypothetical protein